MPAPFQNQGRISDSSNLLEIIVVIALENPHLAVVDFKDPVDQAAEKMAFAGPLTSDDGQVTLGSLLVMDFPDRAAVDAWLKDEPFTVAGVYEKPVVRVFNNMWAQKTGFPPA